MWNLKTKVIPVITGATTTISRLFRTYLSNVQGRYEIKKLQQTAMLGTAHILRKVLMLKYEKFNMGSNKVCTLNCKYRAAATLYTAETWFVSGT
jgi:hypothetical protein